MRAVVRDKPSNIASISAAPDASPAPVPSLPKGRANSAGRSCSAVATACAVPASVRCCASRSTRSTSCT